MSYQLTSTQTPIILASGSPRRQEILASLGVNFKIIVPDIDEKAFDTQNMNPTEKVCFLAEQKANAVAKDHPESIVIGGDTIVVFNNGLPDCQVLEKPEDPNDAERMLTLLSGTTHSVMSAITLCYQNKTVTDVYDTQVTFDTLSQETMAWYISTKEPEGKAGAYAIQGYGSLFVSNIKGCYFNVVGMSPHLLNKMMASLN